MPDPFAQTSLAPARRSRATLDLFQHARRDSERLGGGKSIGEQVRAARQRSVVRQIAQTPQEIEAEAYEDERKRLESEANERQKQEQAAAKAALRAENNANEARWRKSGQPSYVDADGRLQSTYTDEEWAAQKAEKAAYDKQAEEYFRTGQPYRLDPQGRPVTRYTAEEWEAQKKAKAAELEAAKIDKANKAFREGRKSEVTEVKRGMSSTTKAIDLRTQEMDLQHAAAAAEVSKRKRFIEEAKKRMDDMDPDDPQYETVAAASLKMQGEIEEWQAKADLLDADLRSQKAAKLAFEKAQQPMVNAMESAEDAIPRLEAKPATGILPVGSTPAPRTPATATPGVRDQVLDGRVAAIAKDATLDDAARKSALTQLQLRRKDPAAYQTAVKLEFEQADAESLEAKLEQQMQAHEQRMADLQARAQAFTQKRNQMMNSVQVAFQRAQQRLAGPHTAGDLETVPSPDGKSEVSMPRDVAEGYKLSLARAKQWQDANQDEADLLEIESDEANLDAQLLNEGVKVLNAKRQAGVQRQAAERQQQLADLAASGHETQVRKIQGLDQEAEARLADIEEMYPENSPEREAAVKAVQQDIQGQRTAVGQEIEQQAQKAAKVYQDWGRGFAGNWITGETPAVDDVNRTGAVIDENVQAVLKAKAKELGMSEKDLRYHLETQRLMDWSTPSTSASNAQQSGVAHELAKKLDLIGVAEPTRTLPSGDIMPNPELGQSQAKFDAAIDAALGTQEAKDKAKALWPQYREMWLESARATLETSEALPGVESYQDWRDKNAAHLGGMTENQKAELYIQKMEKRGGFRKFLDNVSANLMAGSHDILTAIYGTGAVLAGAVEKATGIPMVASEVLSEAAAEKSQQAQRLTAAQGIEGISGLAQGIIGQSARMAPGAIATMATGTMTGAMVAGAMQTGGMTYADAYHSLIEDGNSHADAWAQAAPASTAAGAMTAVLTKAFPGGVTALNNAANRSALQQGIQQAIRTFAASATSMGKAAVKGFADEVPQEIMDEAFSQFAQGQAQGRAPREVVSEFLTGLPELIGAAGLMGAGGEVLASRRPGRGGSPAPAAPNLSASSISISDLQSLGSVYPTTENRVEVRNSTKAAHDAALAALKARGIKIGSVEQVTGADGQEIYKIRMSKGAVEGGISQVSGSESQVSSPAAPGVTPPVSATPSPAPSLVGAAPGSEPEAAPESELSNPDMSKGAVEGGLNATAAGGAAALPEKWAAAEAALANFAQTTTLPTEVADKTLQKGRVLLKIAQGAKAESLDNDDLHLVGLHRDDAGKITQGHMTKNGWKKGPNPNGSPQPVEVLNGEFIITQRQIERLRNKEVGLGALADAIALPADERRAQILAKSEEVPSSPTDETAPQPGPAASPAVDAAQSGAQETAQIGDAPARGGQAPDAPAAEELTQGSAGTPARTVEADKSVRAPLGDDEIPMAWPAAAAEGSAALPAAKEVHPILAQAGFDEPALERAGLIAAHLQDAGLSADEAAVAAGSVVKRMGVVGDDYTAQMVEDGFSQAMKEAGFQRVPHKPTRWERKPSTVRPVMTEAEKVPSSKLNVPSKGSKPAPPLTLKRATPAKRAPLIERADFKQAADKAMLAEFERLRGAPDKKKAQEEVKALTAARNALVDLVDTRYAGLFDEVVVTPHGNGGGIQARALTVDPKTGRATQVALEIDPDTFLREGSRTREGIERVLNEEFAHRIDLMVSSEREGIDLAKAVHAARPGVFNAAWKQYFAVDIANGRLPALPPAELTDQQAFTLYFEATRLIHQGTFTTENAEMPDIPFMRRIYLYLTRWVQTVRREMRKLPEDLRDKWQSRIDLAESMMRKLQKAAIAADKAGLEDIEPPDSAVKKPKKAPATNDPDLDDELEAAWEAEQKARRKAPTFTPAQQALRGLRSLPDPDNGQVNLLSRIAMEGGIAIYSDKVRKLRKQQGKPVGGELDWLERADIPPFWKGIVFRRGNQQNVDTIVGQLFDEGYFPEAAEQGDVTGEMLAAKIQDVLARYSAQKKGQADVADADEQYGAEMSKLERQRVEFERSTESGPLKVRPADLKPGDVMQVKGDDGQLHPVEVMRLQTRPLEAGEDYDPQGNPGHRLGPDGPEVIESVTLKDGTTFGVQTIDGQEGLYVDEFSVKDGADFDERLREAVMSRKLDDADALLHFMDHYGLSANTPLGEIVRQVQTRLKLPMKKAQQMLAAVFDTSPQGEGRAEVSLDSPLGAAAKRSLLEKPQYHSTPNETAAQSILQSGQVMPPALPHSRGKLTPVVGRVYMAPGTETAAIYSLGGVWMGTANADWWKGHPEREGGQYGYVFQIDPDSVQDIQPDEDNVGELAFKAMDGDLPNAPYWLKSMGERLATPREKRDKWAYANYASLGKRMLKQMSDAQKLEMIERFNTNIAHAGPVRILKAWKVDKARAGELARDGSNLLDVAEPVPLPEPQTLGSAEKRSTKLSQSEAIRAIFPHANDPSKWTHAPVSSPSAGDLQKRQSLADDFGGGTAARPNRAFGEERIAGDQKSQRAALGAIAQRPQSVDQYGSLLDAGGEHGVYISDDVNHVTKITIPGLYGYVPTEDVAPGITGEFRRLKLRQATPAEYLLRTALFSRLTGIDWQVHGVETNDESPDAPVIISTQPFIPSAVDAAGNKVVVTQPQIDAYMASIGFEPVEETTGTTFRDTRMEGQTYWHPQEQILAADARPPNFRQTPDGDVVPVDLMLAHYPLAPQTLASGSKRSASGPSLFGEDEMNFLGDRNTLGLFEQKAKMAGLGEEEKRSGGEAIPKPQTYVQGDLAEYTGETRQIAGGTFYVVTVLEGTRKGKEAVTQRRPDGSNPNTEQAQQAWKDQQAEAKRLHDAGAFKPSPSPVSPSPSPAFTLESPTGSELDAEARRKKIKAELQARQDKPLIGTQGDIGQMDMLGGNDLLSASTFGLGAAAKRAPFYSKLSRVIAEKMPNRADSKTVTGLILNPQTGIKSEEIKWSGIMPWLADQRAAGDKIDKQGVLDYLDTEGAVRLEEVRMGSQRQALNLQWEQQTDNMISAKLPNGNEVTIFYDSQGEYPGATLNIMTADAVDVSEEQEFDTVEQAKSAAAQLARDSGQDTATKFAQYQLPGGENYREVVLAMPVGVISLPEGSEIVKLDGEWFVKHPSGIFDGLISRVGSTSKEGARGRALAELNKVRSGGQGNQYTSSHFPDVPNYVAHARLNDRVDAEGRPGTFVEEIQSDRHQAGREKGYREKSRTSKEIIKDTDLVLNELRARTGEYIPTDEHWQSHTDLAQKWNALTAELQTARQSENGAIPDAPFRTTWPLQMFKRALAEAVAQGKQWIGWTTGDTQAERYDLSKQVDKIEVYPLEKSPGMVAITAYKDGRQAIRQDVARGSMADLIGKEAAQKAEQQLQQNNFATLEGDGLKVGGEGMKGFYDTILPKEIGKYVKQWGAGVEKGNLGGTSKPHEVYQVPAGWAVGTPQGIHAFATEKEARQFAGETQSGTPIWRVDITPAMRSGVEAGQALFSARKRAVSSSKSQVSSSGQPETLNLKPETVDAAAHEAATSPKNDLPEPTPAQREAGNYQKGHVRIAGHDISIENPAGSKRRPEWPALKDHYGYFKGTNAKDGDHVDVFVKPGTPADYAGPVHVVRQNKVPADWKTNPSFKSQVSSSKSGTSGKLETLNLKPETPPRGVFDEYKVMLGYPTAEEARAAYLRNYEPGWPGLHKLTTHSQAEFQKIKDTLFTVPADRVPGVRASDQALASGAKRAQTAAMADPLGAPAKRSLLKKPLLHGTRDPNLGELIVKTGIINPHPRLHSRGRTTPMVGQVYMTSDAWTAQYYAIGYDQEYWHWPYQKVDPDMPRYGYIFEVDRESLEDIQPDEDDVGRLAFLAIKGKSQKVPEWLKTLGEKLVTPKELRAPREIENAASFGKRLLNNMSDQQKLELINNFKTNIAHHGPVRVLKAWRLDRTRTSELWSRQLTFKQVAEEIPVNQSLASAAKRVPGVRASDQALASGAKRAQTAPMADPDQAAQSHEPSPGGLSEAEVRDNWGQGWFRAADGTETDNIYLTDEREDAERYLSSGRKLKKYKSYWTRKELDLLPRSGSFDKIEEASGVARDQYSTFPFEELNRTEVRAGLWANGYDSVVFWDKHSDNTTDHLSVLVRSKEQFKPQKSQSRAENSPDLLGRGQNNFASSKTGFEAGVFKESYRTTPPAGRSPILNKSLHQLQQSSVGEVVANSNQEYLEAVGRGDVSRAQELVDQAIDQRFQDGFWHGQGTPAKGVPRFNPNASEKPVMFGYGRPSNSFWGGRGNTLWTVDKSKLVPVESIPGVIEFVSFHYGIGRDAAGQIIQPPDMVRGHARAWEDERFTSSFQQKFGGWLKQHGFVGVAVGNGGIVFDKTDNPISQIDTTPIKRSGDGSVLGLDQRFPFQVNSFNPSRASEGTLASAAKRGPMEKVAHAVFTKAPVALGSGIAKAGAAVVEKAGLQQVLAKLGSNNLDKFISNVVFGKVAKWAHVDSGKKAVEVWLGKPGALSRLAKGTLDQTVPLWNVPREWLAAYHESQRKAAWGREKAMDVIRALSHNAKVSDLAYPQEFVEDPAWRVKLFDAMEGKADMTALPQPLQDLAERLRKLLKETGQELVRQNIMSLDTFEELSATGWMPRYTEDEAEAAGGQFVKQFMLGVKELLPQRTTAWHVVDTTRKEKDGYAIVSRVEGSKRNRWRFTNEQHRNAWYEDFIRREAVDMLTKGGKEVTSLLAALDHDATRAVRDEIKGLTREKIDRPAELSENLRNVVRRAIELQRFRYKKEAPSDPGNLIKDPVYAVARYVMGATHNAATMELLKTTAKRPEWVSDVALAGYTQMPDNDRFGPLAGKHVKDEIARQILDLVDVPGIVMGTYDAILRTWKAGKLVLNPGSHIRDAVGNVAFSVLAGTNPLNPGNLPYYRDAITALRDGGDTYAELIEMQVLGGDAFTTEVKTALKGLLPDTKTLEKQDAGKIMRLIMGVGATVRAGVGAGIGGLLAGPVGAAAGAAIAVSPAKTRGAYEWAAAVRQVPDNLYKTAAYLKFKAQGMSPAEAAAEVRKWFPYYDRLGSSGLIRNVSRFAMPFSSFFRESTRILGRGAVERPLAMASILGFAYGMTQLSLMMLGLGDEDEESVFRSMRGKLKLGLSGDTPVFSMLLPWRTDEGQLQQWDISSVLPFADLLGTRVEAIDKEDEWTKFWRSMFTQSPILSTAWSWSKNMDPFTGRNIVEDDMGAWESTKERVRKFGDTFLPPLTPWFGVHARTLENAGRRMGGKGTLETRNATQSYLRALVGLDVRSADPNLRTETEHWRKEKKLPLSNDGSGYDVPLRARLGREIKGELIQDAPDLDTIAEALLRLEESGNPIKTREDMEKLLKGLDPDRLIKEEYRRKLIQSFSPEALRVWRTQQSEFKAAQRRLPGVMSQVSPLVRARRNRVASTPVTP